MLHLQNLLNKVPSTSRKRYWCLTVLQSRSPDPSPLDGETVKHRPPYELIRHSIEISTVRGELRVNVSYKNFVAGLRVA